MVKGSWEVKTSVLRTNRMKGGVRTAIHSMKGGVRSAIHSMNGGVRCAMHLMKGGVILYQITIDCNEGWCDTLHQITIDCIEG